MKDRNRSLNWMMNPGDQPGRNPTRAGGVQNAWRWTDARQGEWEINAGLRSLWAPEFSDTVYTSLVGGPADT